MGLLNREMNRDLKDAQAYSTNDNDEQCIAKTTSTIVPGHKYDTATGALYCG